VKLKNWYTGYYSWCKQMEQVVMMWRVRVTAKKHEMKEKAEVTQATKQ
jgi:hypothetical protein